MKARSLKDSYDRIYTNPQNIYIMKNYILLLCSFLMLFTSCQNETLTDETLIEQALAEETIKGAIYLSYENCLKGDNSHKERLVVVENGKQESVNLELAEPELKNALPLMNQKTAGTQVELKGYYSDTGNFIVNPNQVVKQINKNIDATSDFAKLAPNKTVEVLVVLVNYPDSVFGHTAQEIEDVYNNNFYSVNDFFDISTNGKLKIHATVVEYMYDTSIDYDYLTCFNRALFAQAELVEQLGLSLSNYDKIQYASNCLYNISNVGANSQVSVASWFAYTHELGHSLGFFHSGALLNDDFANRQEYYLQDVMGLQGTLLSAAQLDINGLFGNGDVLKARRDGTYTFGKLHDENGYNNPRTVNIPVNTSGGGKADTNYYLSYIQPDSRFNNLNNPFITRDAFFTNEHIGKVILSKTNPNTSGRCQWITTIDLNSSYTNDFFTVNVDSIVNDVITVTIDKF